MPTRADAALRLRAGLLGIRKEHLLTLDTEGRNCLLPMVGDQPVDEDLPVGSFDMPVFIGVDQDDAVLVEEAGVALNQNRQLLLDF